MSAAPSPVRLAFLSNSWLEGDNWGPFQRSLIDHFAAVGDDVLVMRTNSFFYPWSDTPHSPVDLEKAIRVLQDFHPTIVFTVNRAAMAPELVESLPPDTTIITLFIDHYDRVPERLMRFTARDFVWGTGGGWIRDGFVERYRNALAEDRIEFTLWASDTTVYHDRSLKRDLDILFVGSAFQQGLHEIIEALTMVPTNLEIFLATYFGHRERYIPDLVEDLRRRGFEFDAVTEEPYRTYVRENFVLQSFISDQISSEVRLRYLAALADFDLHVYGEPEPLWIQFISVVNAHLFKRYRFRPVKEATELPELYNRAKIGLNIQHHHASNVGLSMRVFDVLASGAVLLTHEITRSPLESLGYEEGVDFVTFRTPEELRSAARRLLDDAPARATLAGSAAAKTRAHHSLKHRLSYVFRKAGHEQVADRFAALAPETIAAGRARVTYVSDPASIDLGLRRRLKPDRGLRERWGARPRTLAELRLWFGLRVPSRLIDVDFRIFRNWFLAFSVRRDPKRRIRR